MLCWHQVWIAKCDNAIFDNSAQATQYWPWVILHSRRCGCANISSSVNFAWNLMTHPFFACICILLLPQVSGIVKARWMVGRKICIFAFCKLPFAFCNLHFAFCNLQFVICNLQFVVYILHFAISIIGSKTRFFARQGCKVLKKSLGMILSGAVYVYRTLLKSRLRLKIFYPTTSHPSPQCCDICWQLSKCNSVTAPWWGSEKTGGEHESRSWSGLHSRFSRELHIQRPLGEVPLPLRAEKDLVGDRQDLARENGSRKESTANRAVSRCYLMSV